MAYSFNILYIITQADLGGAQRSVLNLAQEFHGQIAAGTEKTELFSEARRRGITTHSLRFLKRGINPLWDLLAFFELFFLIHKIKPRIVHLNSTKAGILGSIAGKLAGSKVVFSARGFVFNEPRFFLITYFYIVLEKFASLFRDLIITVSNKDRYLALRYQLKSSNKIISVHNAIPKVEFLDRAAARTELKLTNDKLIIGVVANFYHTKGLDILMQALSSIDKITLATIQVIIVGSGPLEQEIKQQCVELRLTDHITFAGQIQNGAKLFKAFDIFALPSRKEGFPLVLLEAMQAGLPIIATNVGGNAEALGHAGIIIESENPHALAQAIANLTTDSKLRGKLAQAALAQHTIFSYDQYLQKMEQIYQQLLSVGNYPAQ